MGLYRRIINLARRNKLNREIERELSFHVDERVDELVALGMTRREARLRASRQFGNYALQKERTRDMDIHVCLEALLNDVHYAIRGLWKNPGFTAIAICALALGIGANSAIFSTLDAVVLRPLPYADPDRVVMVYEDASAIGFAKNTPAPANDERDRRSKYRGSAPADDAARLLCRARAVARLNRAVWRTVLFCLAAHTRDRVADDAGRVCFERHGHGSTPRDRAHRWRSADWTAIVMGDNPGSKESLIRRFEHRSENLRRRCLAPDNDRTRRLLDSCAPRHSRRSHCRLAARITFVSHVVSRSFHRILG
jgi:hypothetical protein